MTDSSSRSCKIKPLDFESPYSLDKYTLINVGFPKTIVDVGMNDKGVNSIKSKRRKGNAGNVFINLLMRFGIIWQMDFVKFGSLKNQLIVRGVDRLVISVVNGFAVLWIALSKSFKSGRRLETHGKSGLAIVMGIMLIPVNVLATLPTHDSEPAHPPLWNDTILMRERDLQEDQFRDFDNIVPNIPPIPVRPNPKNLPTLRFFLPIPDFSLKSQALVSMMLISLDEFQYEMGILPDAYIDLHVEVVTNRREILGRATAEILYDNVIAFVGDGNIPLNEAQVAAGDFNVPICDGLAEEDNLSDPNLFPTYLRARPNGNFAVNAMAYFIAGNKWKKLAILQSVITYADTDISSTIRYVNVEDSGTLSVIGQFFVAFDSAKTSHQFTPCQEALRQIKDTFCAIIVYLGEADTFQSCWNYAKSLHMSTSDGYTWIVNDLAIAGLQNLTDYNGLFVVSVVEGTGPLYDRFLKTQWQNTTIQQRYPAIAPYAIPPQGFMFYRTCLQLILSGYNKMFQVQTSQIKKKSEKLEAVKEKLNVAKNEYNLEGPMHKAIELLKSLRDPETLKCVKNEQVDFLIEVFVSGNSYSPNFDKMMTHGGKDIDEEMQAWVMGSILAKQNNRRPRALPSGGVTDTIPPSGVDPRASKVSNKSFQSAESDGKGGKGSGQNDSKRTSSQKVNTSQSQIDVPQSGRRQSDAGEIDPDKPARSNTLDSAIKKFHELMDFVDHLELISPVKNLAQVDEYEVTNYLDLWYHNWNFDMFEFSQMSGGHPLYWSTKWLIESLECLDKFGITMTKFSNWLLIMESEYHPHPYHNAIHAADVMHSFNYLLYTSEFGSRLTEIEKLAGVIAAVGHDIDHPFLVKSRHAMATMYSDTSVNEYHHSAHVFQVTLNSAAANIFADLSMEDYEELRKIVIRLILCTDMGKHFEYLTKFKAKLSTNTFTNMEIQENRLMTMEMGIKCSDLNNPSKTPELASKWVSCIMEEFYRQGDCERELGLPISQFMDRGNTNIPKCQIGFIDILVAPLYDAWITLCANDDRASKIKTAIERNRMHWAALSGNTAQGGAMNNNSIARINSVAANANATGIGASGIAGANMMSRVSRTSSSQNSGTKRQQADDAHVIDFSEDVNRSDEELPSLPQKILSAGPLDVV
ncbi:cAMP-specific 3',5'-cyclic phosphodiesterase 4D [Blyttiomyces sp. JEL0837]|nr:cAMP-specific 3',5'-cyclic phosphodiesterase 4D [Blyttiomyces sp. JEL0837]